jgi:hypothetical protein
MVRREQQAYSRKPIAIGVFLWRSRLGSNPVMPPFRNENWRSAKAF